MAEIIQFPVRPQPDFDEPPEIDLVTALDVAIRDLGEIAELTSGAIRVQAQECRAVLEQAYRMIVT